MSNWQNIHNFYLKMYFQCGLLGKYNENDIYFLMKKWKWPFIVIFRMAHFRGLSESCNYIVYIIISHVLK